MSTRRERAPAGTHSGPSPAGTWRRERADVTHGRVLSQWISSASPDRLRQLLEAEVRAAAGPDQNGLARRWSPLRRRSRAALKGMTTDAVLVRMMSSPGRTVMPWSHLHVEPPDVRRRGRD